MAECIGFFVASFCSGVYKFVTSPCHPEVVDEPPLIRRNRPIRQNAEEIVRDYQTCYEVNCCFTGYLSRALNRDFQPPQLEEFCQEPEPEPEPEPEHVVHSKLISTHKTQLELK
jgi:hypothetical protein